MKQFDTLTIQKNIEEKRLIFGKRFEDFLLKNLRVSLRKSDEFLCSKNFCPWSISLVFLLSVYLRSMLDIGSSSSVYLDLAEKIFRGGKYYYDFFEGNSPLSFWLHIIPYSAAKFFKISPIISAEIFINFLGILSLVFSAKILEKSTLTRVHKNLIITSFSVGFFLRIHALGVNEFLTKTSFLLCFAYPYIAFSFSRKTALSKKEMFCRGLLGGLMPCLKPHYILLPLVIEISRFWQKKSLRFFSELDKLVMSLIGVLYVLLMLKLTPEFFEFMVPMWSKYYPSYNSTELFLLNLSAHLSSEILFFGGIFLVFLRQKFSTDDKVLFLVFFSAALIIIFESAGTIDQIACFFGLIIPVFIKIFYDFLKSEKTSFDKVGLVCVFFLILAFVESGSFYTMARISIFWWIIIPILTINLLKKFKLDHVKFVQIIPSYVAVTTFILLVAISFMIASIRQEAYVLISVFVILIYVFFYEKIYAKFYKNFSSFFIFFQSFAASTLIAFILSSVLEAYSGSTSIKFPNFLSDKIVQYSKIYAAGSGDNIFIWSNHISFSIYNYLGNPSSHIYNNLNPLHAIDLKNLIKDRNIKIIFINNESEALRRKDRCMVGFLENYFQDEEFKKTFLQNYQFVGRIFLTKTIDKKQIAFFVDKGDESEKLDLPKSQPIYDFEVYARKNN